MAESASPSRAPAAAWARRSSKSVRAATGLHARGGARRRPAAPAWAGTSASSSARDVDAGGRAVRRPDRLHATRGYARAPCRLRAPRRRAVVGTTGLDDSDKRALRDFGTRDSHRLRGEHERRRQRAALARRGSGARAGSGVRHRDRRDAPQAQGRRAVGHRAAARAKPPPPGSAGASSTRSRSPPATASRASARRARSASRRFAAATSSASTRCSSRARASASRSRTARPRASCSWPVRCARREFVAAKRARGEAGVFDMPDVLGLR